MSQRSAAPVAVLSMTPNGTLMVDFFVEGEDTKPGELLKAGFTGVRIALPQTIVYDYDAKKKVTEVNVPISKGDSDDS